MQDEARIGRELALRAAVLAGEEAAWRTLYDAAYAPLLAFAQGVPADGQPLEAVSVIETDSTVPDKVLVELLRNHAVKMARSVALMR